MEAQQCVKLSLTNRSIGLIHPYVSIKDMRNENVASRDKPAASTRRQGVAEPLDRLRYPKTRTVSRTSRRFPPESDGRSDRRFAKSKAADVLGRPGGYGEGLNTRSHPELGRENPQRRWYCVLRRGRVGRRQVFQARIFQARGLPGTEQTTRTTQILRSSPRLRQCARGQQPANRQHTNTQHAGWSSPVARQAHNLKVAGSNPAPATKQKTPPTQ